MSAAAKVKDSGKKAKRKGNDTGRDVKGRFTARVSAAAGAAHVRPEGKTDPAVTSVKGSVGKAKAGPAKTAAKAGDTATKSAVKSQSAVKTQGTVKTQGAVKTQGPVKTPGTVKHAAAGAKKKATKERAK
jgi:hypothetical protein